MKKVLNQEEIDAMVRTVRTGGRADTQAPAALHVELWTCAARDRSGTSSCRVQPRCTEALPGIVAIPWSLTCAPSSPPLSVEHLTYREFLQLAPETTCLLSCLDTKA